MTAVHSMQDLAGKVVIVTGAGSGIGLETARHFLAAGARVLGAGRSIERFADLAAGPEARALEADLTDSDAGTRIVAEALSTFGRIDILFNNAGAAPARTDFLSVTDAEWLDTLNLNLLGYVRMARAVLPPMLAQRSGVLVHCGSEAAVKPHPLLPDYSVSKAGVNALSKILSRDYTRAGVRSNVVAPAHVRTELWDAPGGFLDSLADHYGVPRADRDGAIAAFLKDSSLPAGRLGHPADVARAVLFLASDASAFISGCVLGVDGGVIPTI